jgi:hypothetical protein
MKRNQTKNIALAVLSLLAVAGCSTAQTRTSAVDPPAAAQRQAVADTPEAVWSAMLSHLKAGDIEGASSYFSVATKDDYRKAFLALSKDELRSTLKDMESIKRASVEGDSAQCYFESKIDGQVITFPIEFVKEFDQWRIVEY